MGQDRGRRRCLQAVLAAGCAAAGLPARAGGGRVVIGFARAGAGIPAATALLRELAGRYQPDLGSDLFYLPGNVGAIAIDAVHKAPADGGTVLMTPSSVMTLLPYLRNLPQVDAVTDFVPVAGLACIANGLAVGPAVPAAVKTLKDYGRWLGENPTQCSYGLVGLGTSPHFVAMMMAQALGLPLKPAPYKGPGPMVADLTSGSLPAALLTSGAVMQVALAGGARLIAVSSAQRWVRHPDVQTMHEAGVAELPPPESFGFFVSARTPEAKVRELGDAIRQAVRGPAVQSVLDASSLLPLPAQADDYPALMAQERANWGRLVKIHRFSAEA